MTPDELGLAYNWKIGPSTRDIGDGSYIQAAHAFSGVARKPFSPVRIRGARDAFGNLTISWLRRTRAGGDSWEPADVPLNETSERYEVDILDGATVVRSGVVTSPAFTYPVSDQIADFGSPQSSVAVRICQVSEVAGRGSTRSAHV